MAKAKLVCRECGHRFVAADSEAVCEKCKSRKVAAEKCERGGGGAGLMRYAFAA